MLVEHTVKRSKDFDPEQALKERRLPISGFVAVVSRARSKREGVVKLLGLYALDDKLELQEYSKD
jgi:hypothetical protein